ncbi:SDR family NAD(P)-dependent oxidoreductase [Demequina sp. NBRC 110053]|uniref:SDR family NAD(P)-dependent oxidoreductase n=1 Tax=Demequina sp. NBRC 110053 TaxID=1570342 RepID=UPI000A06AB29|nr:SDR family oxidoreductase [Demequina sp. NBRC 110053]
MITRPLALVTGGSRGLGRSTTLALARQGADAIITFRSGEADAARVVEEAGELGATVAAFQLDVGDPDAIAALGRDLPEIARDACGREQLDYLVNNAGHGAVTALGHTDAETLDGLYAVHFRGPFLLTQAVAPLLADGGAIVNLSTGLARFSSPGYSAYGSLKAGLEHLTRYWAAELGPRGIRVNAVAPGAIATDFAGGKNRDDEQSRAFVASSTAMGRVGEPEDIGPLIASLLTGPTGWVTGQRIEASGGMRL